MTTRFFLSNGIWNDEQLCSIPFQLVFCDSENIDEWL